MFSTILNITFILVLIYFWWLNTAGQPLEKYFGVALGLKIVAAISSYWLYWYVYGEGDALHYYELAKQLVFYARHDASGYTTYLFTSFNYDNIPTQTTYGHEPRTIFFVKTVSVLMLLTSFKPVYISIYLSLFCLAGFWSLANRIALYYIKSASAAAIAFLLFPTLVFWGAGLLKEPIALGAMAFMLSLFLKVYKSLRYPVIGEILLSLVCAYWLWQLRYFYAIPLFGLMTWAIIMRILSAIYQIRFWVSSIASGLTATALIIVIAWQHPLFHEGVFWLRLWESYRGIEAQAQVWALLTFDDLEPNALSFARHIPRAVFAGLYSPLPWQAYHLPGYLVAIERTILLLITVWAIIRVFFKNIKTEDRTLLYSVLLFVIGMAILIPFASPSFGSLVRFQAAYLPFLVFLCLYTISPGHRSHNQL